MEFTTYCPYCGERVSLWIEESDESSSYTEDCPVCCHPWDVSVRRDPDGTAHVHIEQQN